MDEIEPANAEPKTLTGWALGLDTMGEIVLHLEFIEGEHATHALSLAIPREAARYLADELLRKANQVPVRPG